MKLNKDVQLKFNEIFGSDVFRRILSKDYKLLTSNEIHLLMFYFKLIKDSELRDNFLKNPFEVFALNHIIINDHILNSIQAAGSNNYHKNTHLSNFYRQSAEAAVNDVHNLDQTKDNNKIKGSDHNSDKTHKLDVNDLSLLTLSKLDLNKLKNIIEHLPKLKYPNIPPGKMAKKQILIDDYQQVKQETSTVLKQIYELRELQKDGAAIGANNVSDFNGLEAKGKSIEQIHSQYNRKIITENKKINTEINAIEHDKNINYDIAQLNKWIDIKNQTLESYNNKIDHDVYHRYANQFKGFDTNSDSKDSKYLSTQRKLNTKPPEYSLNPRLTTEEDEKFEKIENQVIKSLNKLKELSTDHFTEELDPSDRNFFDHDLHIKHKTDPDKLFNNIDGPFDEHAFLDIYGKYVQYYKNDEKGFKTALNMIM